MNTRLPTALLLPISLLLGVLFSGCEQEQDAGRYDVIIYGGGPQAVSAALQFSAVTKQKSPVLMIVPERAFGSVMTLGKQNLFDVNYFEPKSKPSGVPGGYKGSQAGSLFGFLRDMSPVFPPEQMERYLEKRIRERKNITYVFEHDLTRVAAVEEGSGWRIQSVTFQKLVKNDKGHYEFAVDTPGQTATAQTFIDASETGRLLTLSGHHIGTVGREDQNPDSRQMAATLMFKLRGIDAGKTTQNGKTGGAAMSDKGAFQFWGGYEVHAEPSFLDYEQSQHPFRIKPFNAGEDGYAGTWDTEKLDFWMNMLLVYDVDARKAKRDFQLLGIEPGESGLDPETARDLAAEEVGRPDFIELLRKIPGFEHAQLVYKNGRPETGEILYLRESIHTASKVDPAARIYDFALDRTGVTGGDAKYYAHRIGLGYYQFDSNSYKKGEKLSNPMGSEPWYVPYEVLLHPNLTNVLIPGYAANMDSFSWTAMRVFPNLIMLGDAAGTAAGLSAQGDFQLHQPTDKQIEWLQARLKQANVILDK